MPATASPPPRATARITTLSPAQWGEMRRWRDDWRTIGMSTERADRQAAQDVVTQMYTAIGKPRPLFLWTDSPLSATGMIGLLEWVASDSERMRSLSEALRSQLGSQLDSQLWSQLWSQLGSQLGSQLWSQLGSQLDSQLWSQLWSQLDSQLGSQLGSQLWSQLGSQLDSQLWSQLWSQLGSQLRSQLDSQLGSQLDSQLWSQLWSQLGSQLWSQLDSQLGSQLGSPGAAKPRLAYRSGFWSALWSSWWVHLRFCEQVAGVQLTAEQSERLGWWVTLARSAFAWWPFEGVCVFSERPTQYGTEQFSTPDEHGWAIERLHSADGPAILFADAYSLYAWHGVQVPREVIEAPAALLSDRAKRIVAETNVEVRRAMLERVGPESFLAALGAKRVQADDYGSLYRVRFEDDEPLVMVDVVNSTAEPDGSFKHYWLRVPPSIETARAAVAWTFGVEATAYAPAVET